MKAANYYIFGGLFTLLECAEVSSGVDFSSYDPDDARDVEKLATDFLRPAVERAPESIQRSLRWSIEYYAETGSAPLDRLRGGCQELSLPDPDCWRSFLRHLGCALYGDGFLDACDPADYVEALDDRPSQVTLC